MILTDSHCHLHMLDLAEFDHNLDKVIQAANNNQVEKLLCVGTTLDDLEAILRIAQQYPSVFASVGLHPNEYSPDDNEKPADFTEPNVEKIVELANSNPKIVAIGETGLDYYRSTGNMEWQQKRFRTHIQAAREAKKPLIIHTRNARADTLKILHEENAREVGGVFHCFTEDWDTAQAAIDLGFFVSFSGIVTFKNAVELQDIAKRMPLKHMLIETDSPFLAPMPHRGKMNHPAFVRLVAEFIARIKEVELKEVADITTHNYGQLFKA